MADSLIYTRQYTAWSNMKRRCLDPKNPAYVHYGGRGIKVCDEWLKFKNFWEDMQHGYSDELTIERIDNNKGYYKENCRWVTMKEQSNNRRNSTRYTVDGVTKTLTQWCDETDIKPSTIRQRIYVYGWGIEKALSTKPRKRG